MMKLEKKAQSSVEIFLYLCVSIIIIFVIFAKLGSSFNGTINAVKSKVQVTNDTVGH